MKDWTSIVFSPHAVLARPMVGFALIGLGEDPCVALTRIQYTFCANEKDTEPSLHLFCVVLLWEVCKPTNRQ